MTVLRLHQFTPRQKTAREALEALAVEAAFTAAITVADVQAHMLKHLPGETHIAVAWSFWNDLVEAVYARDSVPVDSGDPEDELARDAEQSYVDAAFRKVGL
jgi:hypothetical protein